MNRIMLAVSFSLAVIASASNAADQKVPEVLSIQHMTVGNTTVALPTVKNADGTVCVSYLASASRDKAGTYDTSVKQFCGKSNANGSAPSDLIGIQNVEKDGMMTQMIITKQ